jgi:hypothetical protein
MGFEQENEMPVTNIFARYSLKLISDREFYDDMRGMLNIDFILDDPLEEFKQRDSFDVPEMEVEDPTEDYTSFQEKIYLLRHNILFESLLREGINLKRYRIITIKEEGEYLLIYRSEERREWINLGRFRSKAETVRIANQFRQFLILLNRQSESFYLVEHLLLRSVYQADGYSLQIMDPAGNVAFSLLNPVGWTSVHQLKGEAQKALTDLSSFRIERTERENYILLLQLSGDSILYCMQEFSDEETARFYLAEFADGYGADAEKYTQVCYQRDNELMLPHDFMDFEVSLVFPAWSARFHNVKFRDWCEEVLAERLPAHLRMQNYWLDVPDMREFELLYFQWREALANRNGEESERTSIALSRFLYRKR